MPMKTICPDCGKFGPDAAGGRGLLVCRSCYLARIAELQRRQLLPVGGLSCPESFEQDETQLGGNHLISRVYPTSDRRSGRRVVWKEPTS